MNLDSTKDYISEIDISRSLRSFPLASQEKKWHDSTSFVVAQEMFHFGLLSVSARKGKGFSEARCCSLSSGQAVCLLAAEVPIVTPGPFSDSSVTTLVTPRIKTMLANLYPGQLDLSLLLVFSHYCSPSEVTLCGNLVLSD